MALVSMDQYRQRRYNTSTGAVHVVSIDPSTGTETDLGAISEAVADPMLEISRGVVSGVAHVNKFGENSTVTKNTTEDVWDGGGTITLPATADITHIKQAVHQEAMKSQLIEVQGLNASWAQVTQTKALDDTATTTKAELGTPLRRVFRMRVLANVVGDQDIHAQNTGGGTNYATIVAGNNQTLMAVYTVAADKTAYITNYYADQIPDASGTKDPNRVSFRLWAADNANSYQWQLKHSLATTAAGASLFQHRFGPYLKITEKSDIKITANPSSDKDAHVHAGFDLILVDN